MWVQAWRLDKSKKNMMKQTHWLLNAALATAIGIAVFGFAGCKDSKATQSNSTQSGASSKIQYTCPEVVQDKPGSCPKCGMALVEKH